MTVRIVFFLLELQSKILLTDEFTIVACTVIGTEVMLMFGKLLWIIALHSLFFLSGKLGVKAEDTQPDNHYYTITREKYDTEIMLGTP